MYGDIFWDTEHNECYVVECPDFIVFPYEVLNPVSENH